MPNWPPLSPLPHQEYSSNWVGSWSHAVWSHSSTPSSSLSLPPGEPAQGMPNHAPQSRFLYCSYTPSSEINSNRELGGVLWDLVPHFTGTASSSPSFLEFVYAICWYRNLWQIATTAQLKEEWIRVLFWETIEFYIVDLGTIWKYLEWKGLGHTLCELYSGPKCQMTEALYCYNFDYVEYNPTANAIFSFLSIPMTELHAFKCQHAFFTHCNCKETPAFTSYHAIRANRHNNTHATTQFYNKCID